MRLRICFVATLLAMTAERSLSLRPQLPLVRRIIRLIDGELVHRGLPQMLRQPRRLQIDLAFRDPVRQRAVEVEQRAVDAEQLLSAARPPRHRCRSSSANCRVTRSSALMPTRSLKALWPLMAGVISLRRKSATALISSVGVGSSCISTSPRGQQPQQIDLGLRRAPPDHRPLHRMIGAGAKALHHAAAHDAPAQRAHHFPEHHASGIDLAAGRLIAREQILARCQSRRPACRSRQSARN